MKEQLISFETAKLAYQKQFQERTEYFYTEENELCRIDSDGEILLRFNDDLTIKDYIYNCNGEFWFKEIKDEEETLCQSYEPIKYYAPTQSLLQKWLREKYNMQVFCYSHTLKNGKYGDYVISFNGIYLNDARDEEFQTYEEALEVGLQYALNRI